MTSVSGRPTYLAAPNCDYKPDALVFLGALLTDPLKLGRTLNEAHRPKSIPDLQETCLVDCKESMQKLRAGRLGLWTGFVQYITGIGGEVDVGHRAVDEAVYHFDQLETRYFEPDDDFIRQSLQAPDAQMFLNMGFRRKPVYMITGLKIARGASATIAKSRKHGVKLEVGVNGSVLGIPASVGPSVEVSNKLTQTTSFQSSTDFVFAYRVIKISRFPWKSGFKHSGYSKGALYDLDANHARDSKDDPEEFKVETDIPEVATSSSTEALNVEDDDGGEMCIIMSSYGEDPPE